MIIGRFYKRFTNQIGYVKSKQFKDSDNEILYTLEIVDCTRSSNDGPAQTGKWDVYESNSYRWKLIENDTKYKLECL